MRPLTTEEMLVRMAGLCAGAEQCSADIRAKVLKKGFQPETADRIVGYLVQNRYLDDARFARAFAADKVKFAGWGRAKVRLHLKAKRLADNVIAQALDYICDDDYLLALRKALVAKAKSLDLSQVDDRRKLYRHLASRGFESQLIIAEIRKYIKDNADN